VNTRCLSILALLVLAGLARAETNFGECIEWAVADSERVVVGKITMVERAGQHEIVTVAVSKTFRGKHEEKVRFVVREAGGNVQGWMKANVPMLFCLVKRDQIKEKKGLPDHDLFLRHGASTFSAVFLGKTDQGAIDVFTRDFEKLTDPAAIIKHVETYAKTLRLTKSSTAEAPSTSRFLPMPRWKVRGDAGASPKTPMIALVGSGCWRRFRRRRTSRFSKDSLRMTPIQAEAGRSPITFGPGLTTYCVSSA
jgi:hypothetical protein